MLLVRALFNFSTYFPFSSLHTGSQSVKQEELLATHRHQQHPSSFRLKCNRSCSEAVDYLEIYYNHYHPNFSSQEVNLLQPIMKKCIREATDLSALLK